MSKGTLKINSQNILPIIKKWLYSDRDIFLRELVSNSCDAIAKLKILRDQGLCDFKDDELKINIQIDKENKTISIADTGIGMTSEEVENYIAQLAFSGAEEFVDKYSSSEGKDQIIGHFGLGFYSSFMVSKLVEINTLSYKNDASSAHWSCDGSSEYTLDQGTLENRGTTITMHINEESEEFLEEAKLKAILEKYASFLPYPIYLNEKLINEQEPLWMKAPSECKDEDYLKLYRYLYPMQPDPLFWIHLNVDYPFHLKGILFFPKINKNVDFKQSQVHLYCNRVFVSDSCKEILPDYLMILKGVIDSPDIPLNVSRSYLQVDKTVRALGNHISKKIVDKLSSLYNQDFEKYTKCWEDIETILKLGILQDEKFYTKAKDLLVWKNSKEEFTSLKDYLERANSKHENEIFYSFDENHNSHFLEMYKEKNIEVLFANSYLDTPLMSFIESKESPIKFKRIDASAHSGILDESKEKTVLNEDGKTEATVFAETFKTLLSQDDLEVEAKSLSSDNVPAFVAFDETQRRMRDYLSIAQKDMAAFPQKRTLVVNTNNKLIQAIYKLAKSNGDLASSLSQQVYDLSLLQQKELTPESFPEFVKRTSALLQDLATQLSS